MDSLSNIDKIHDYLTAKLKGGALVEFENALENDEQLQNEVAYYRDLFRELRAVHFQQIKAKGVALINQIESTSNTRTRDTFFKWLIPIILGLGLILALAYYFGNKKVEIITAPTQYALVQNAWKNGPQLPYYSFRSERNIDSLEMILFEAFAAYTNKDYATMEKILAAFESKTPKYEDSLLLRAIANYKQKNVSIALQLLETGLETSQNNQRVLMIWFKSLILLEEGKETEARFLLKKITTNENKATVAARKLLEHL